MARLWITPREIDFIADITKELVKDVIGEQIHFYPISAIKSKVHDLYEESPDKVFEHPITIEALVDFKPNEIRTNEFGIESFRVIEIYVQTRDLDDRGIVINMGDFLTYGPTLYEISEITNNQNIFGQVEYDQGIKMVAREARKSQFYTKVFGPLGDQYSDVNAVRNTFQQQRGLTHNKDGETGDARTLQKKGILDPPLSGQSSVLPPSGSTDNSTSAFYDEQ